MLDYADPLAESILQIAPGGGALVLVSDVAQVSSRAKNGFDRQKKEGANFGRVKFLGKEPASFTATFIVLPEEEDNFWTEVYPLFRPKGRRGTAPPLDVINPQINRTGVSTVFAVSIEVDPPSQKTGRQITIQLEEWTPAPVEPKDDNSRKTTKDPQNLQPSAIQDNQ